MRFFLMRSSRLVLLIAALALTPNAASAHVRVFPASDSTQAPACGFTEFDVRVPVEKPIATNRLDVMIPAGVIVYAVRPKPGWQFNLQTTRGVVSTISWTGGQLMPHEFDDFSFLAATPKKPGTVSWDAWQYYTDGSIVKWTGVPGSDTPHSITTITAAPCHVRKKGK
jgi:uncharacterized protein YcnI